MKCISTVIARMIIASATTIIMSFALILDSVSGIAEGSEVGASSIVGSSPCVLVGISVGSAVGMSVGLAL